MANTRHKEILQRIGDKQAKIFNVYYQAPIAKECCEFTAFMTHIVLYEWTRLPMKPTGACLYFQQDLATEVFDELVQKIHVNCIETMSSYMLKTMTTASST